MVLREHGSGTRFTLHAALERLGLDQVAPVLELASTAAVHAAGVAPTMISDVAIADDVAAGPEFGEEILSLVQHFGRRRRIRR